MQDSASTYSVTSSDIPSGRLYQVLAGESRISFRQFFDLLESSEEFSDWYSDLLAEFDAPAFYWELPPLTITSIDNPTEFVLIGAPMLARMPPNPSPFASLFDRHPDDDVAVFPNLGGDAILVAPCPRGPAEAYPHFATFLRLADQGQVRALWQATATTVLRNLREAPTWVSTAGGGVAWLHVRLDSRPKYYSYRPYAERQG